MKLVSARAAAWIFSHCGASPGVVLVYIWVSCFKIIQRWHLTDMSLSERLVTALPPPRLFPWPPLCKSSVSLQYNTITANDMFRYHKFHRNTISIWLDIDSCNQCRTTYKHAITFHPHNKKYTEFRCPDSYIAEWNQSGFFVGWTVFWFQPQWMLWQR